MRRFAPSAPLITTSCAIIAMLAAALFVTACSGSGGPQPHPAVTAVSELLELRRADVRDPAAYEPYVGNPELAAALADGSIEPTGTPRVPPYRPPYLSAESTSTADVAVVWEPDDAFPGWTPVAVFSTVLEDGRWVVVDALETTAAPEPLLPEAD